ncbi:MAG TPA: type VI secretion system-associated FHA domain protein TagH [Burkholderiales bacterium]|nr:type VI secretion system-associated FHA domain protein TagH [Burkholderiales bacterium]
MRRAVDGRPSLYATRDFDVLPISIGRDAACTIALEDPNKHMSRFHVEIQEADGTYWMSVVSKVNPVMVKGTRYGPGARATLQSGDSFELAEYEVQVLLPQPAPAEPAVPPVDPQELGTSTQIRRGDEAEHLFNESTFLGDEKPAPLPEETFIPQRAAPALPSHPLRAFFEGAGLPHRELSPMQTDRMLRDCGAILRAAIEGIMMLMAARAEMRKEFGADERTLVATRDNNPLRMMSDAREAMDFLFDPGERTDGFLEPVQAVGDACQDLRAHELALMAGMRAAVLSALRRFDPPALERALEKSTKGFSLASRKAKLWEAFVAGQDKLSRDAQADFNKIFGRDFMGAYQEQLKRLKGSR